MSEIGIGVHPKFNLSNFSVSQQRALRRLSQLTHLNRDGEVGLGRDTKFKYALVRPTQLMRGLLHSDREVMVVFSDYPEFQSRALDAFDRVLIAIPDEFRVEKVARILISDDPDVALKIKKLFQSKPDAPVVVPFYVGELSLASTDKFIASRIREFTYTRDLFSMSSPLRSDLYFYGRSSLINEICSKLASGENFGLFGLRRSGKTSIVHGLGRAVRTRSGSAVIIDCQSPAVHQRRWYELLEQIVRTTKEQLSSTANISKSEKYNDKDAAESFVRDMRAIRKNSKVEFIALLFDEIEKISFGTASSQHWNTERDFLHFWQAIRYGFQTENSPYSFVIVGTNPSAVEKVKIFESDNPLFGNVEKRFIPMFTPQQVNEMVDDLGAIMGVHIDDDCKGRLYVDFGGHPFLTRYACSYIGMAAKERPVEIDRTVYAVGIDKFKTEANSYVESVVGLLRDEYRDEFEMLKYLGTGDMESFNGFADSDPRLYEHLIGYGIVAKGVKSFYFRIAVVESYFLGVAKPIHILDQAGRLAEISSRRNVLEKDCRRFIFQVLRISCASGQRREKLLSKVSPSRRVLLAEMQFSDLLSEGESPLFFDELKTVIMGNWEMFSNAVSLQKNELEYHFNTINSFRSDAHSKDIGDDQFEKWRVSLSELSHTFN